MMTRCITRPGLLNCLNPSLVSSSLVPLWRVSMTTRPTFYCLSELHSASRSRLILLLFSDLKSAHMSSTHASPTCGGCWSSFRDIT